MSNSKEKRIGDFLDHGDGTASDTRTGLMWMRCALGQIWDENTCTGNPSFYKLDDSIGLTSFAGYADWRLPTKDELLSLVDLTKDYVAIDLRVFPRAKSYFWATSAGAKDQHSAWQIDFSDGKAFPYFHKSDTATYSSSRPASRSIKPADPKAYVRLVRNGKSFLDTDKTIHIKSNVDDVIEIAAPDFDDASVEMTLLEWQKRVGDRVQKDEVLIEQIVLDGGAATSNQIIGRIRPGSSENQHNAKSEKREIAFVSSTEFKAAQVFESSIQIEVESVEDTSLSNGEPAFIFYLNLWNKGTKQIRLEYSPMSYVNRLGEEIEAGGGITGLMKVYIEKTVRAGTFQKIGAYYYKSRLDRIFINECLHISVTQTKLSIRINYSFKCTDAIAKTFVLMETTTEEVPPKVDPWDTMKEVLNLKTQVRQLSSDLLDLKQKLELIGNTKVNRSEPPKKKSALVKTLPKILQWLATQEQIKVAELRMQLLPLDTLPSAVINELNEQALDLTGELALEENGNEIVVNQEILKKVLANK